MKGILADNDVRGQVDHLVALMEAEPWRDFWVDFALVVFSLEDVGLSPDTTDRDVWQVCQAEEIVLITANRNMSGPDSLEATIRVHSTSQSLPVLTIADVKKLNASKAYAEEIVESLID